MPDPVDKPAVCEEVKDLTWTAEPQRGRSKPCDLFSFRIISEIATGSVFVRTSCMGDQPHGRPLPI
jgi:hypothetical protein